MRSSTIYKINQFFKTIDYSPPSMLDIDVILYKTQQIMIRCTSILDVHQILFAYEFVKKKYRSINRILSRSYPNQISHPVFNDVLSLDLISEENSKGNMIITNAFSKKRNRIQFFYNDNHVNQVIKKGKKFYLYSESSYHIIYHLGKTTIKDSNNKSIMNISYQNLKFISKQNRSNWVLLNSNNALEIVDKSLSNEENVIARIDCDILKKNSDLSTCLLSMYTEDNQELIQIIGLASVLLLGDLHFIRMMYMSTALNVLGN